MGVPSAIPDLPALTAADFRRISNLAHEKFGLNLPPGKEGLVAARLAKKIRAGGFASFGEYYRHVVADGTGEALIDLIDALATNFTSFLREPAHFDFLKAIVAGEFAAQPSLRIWSAASSSGEEPYSIAMTLAEIAQMPVCRWAADFKILASDISTRVLKKAREAIYDADRFHGIPDHWRRAFLLKGNGDYAGSYKLAPEITKLVQFERINLIEPLPHRTFHVVFCRNVMIYFERATQQDIVARLRDCIEPGGYLLVGHSETLNGIDHGFAYVKPAVYRKQDGRKQEGRSRRKV